MALLGASVVILGRNEDKCRSAFALPMNKIGSRAVDHLVADLSDLERVRRIASDFTQKRSLLDVLVNNAGTRFMSHQKTRQGIEMTFVLNHLAHFLLTHLLIGLLSASAPTRIINVSSGSQTAGLDFENLYDWKSCDDRKAYAQSKLSNLLFTYELSRRLEGTGVTVNAVNRGWGRPPTSTRTTGGSTGCCMCWPI
ncbi:MAG: SDR family NAD(P)-dependent oxidoreductase [Desulfobacterales bacterium]|nr:SDR family NAD(P)-dependent oxidoreductase [Desulfobacterales bacterium]